MPAAALEMVDVGVGAGEEERDVACVLPANQERRSAAVPAGLQDLTVALGLAEPVAVDHEPVSRPRLEAPWVLDGGRHRTRCSRHPTMKVCAAANRITATTPNTNARLTTVQRIAIVPHLRRAPSAADPDASIRKDC
jgi:hypothetical protein